MSTKTATPSRRQAAADRYLELIRAFPPRPIKNDAEHCRAIEAIDKHADRDRLTLEEEDYLVVLALIVEAYEDSIYDHPERTAVDRLRYLMTEHGLTQAALAREAGIAVQSLNDVLHEKRRISPKVREKLAARFGVPAYLFA